MSIENQIPWIRPDKETWHPNEDRSRSFLFLKGTFYGRVKVGKDWIAKNYDFTSLSLYNQAFFSNKDMYPYHRAMLMEVREIVYKDGVTDLIISMGAIDPAHDLRTATYYGNGHINIGDGFSPIYESLYEQTTKDLAQIDSLPKNINVAETAKAFISQVAGGNYSKPQLILP